MRTRATVVALAAMLLSIGAVQAAGVPESTKFGPVPAGTGDGLNGTFWDIPWDDYPESLAEADGHIATLPALVTFVATYIDYPNGSVASVDGGTLSEFLGSDAVTLSGTGSTNFDSGCVFLFQGYIKITSDLDVAPGGSIDVDFSLGSDDGSRLKIGGIPIITRDGTIPFGVTAGTASFDSPGLYPFELVYFDSWGGKGLEFSSSIASSHLGSGSVGIVPPDHLYTTPEPASLSLLALGALALLRRRK